MLLLLGLAGFRSLDEREDRYKEAREIVRATKVKNMSVLKNFFNEIFNKTKSLLIDDLDGKTSTEFTSIKQLSTFGKLKRNLLNDHLKK